MNNNESWQKEAPWQMTYEEYLRWVESKRQYENTLSDRDIIRRMEAKMDQILRILVNR